MENYQTSERDKYLINRTFNRRISRNEESFKNIEFFEPPSIESSIYLYNNAVDHTERKFEPKFRANTSERKKDEDPNNMSTIVLFDYDNEIQMKP